MIRPHDRVRDAWELVTPNGVTVRPTEAIVRARRNQGWQTAPAEAFLPAARRAFERADWPLLRRTLAELHLALEAGAPPEPPIEPIAEPRHQPAPSAPSVSPPGTEERTRAGWLGKTIGGALGTPVEGWTHDRIVERYGSVTGYLAPPTTVNDDTAFQLALLAAVERHGLGVSSLDIGLEWVERIEDAYTAEQIAIENLEAGVAPPRSGRFRNPYSHWIGAMMRGEICGWLHPGRPDLAVDLARRDAVISHEGPGVDGELFTAATIAAAYGEPDVRELIHVGLRAVPGDGEFARVGRAVLAWCEGSRSWQQAWTIVERELVSRHHWIHVLPNLAAVIVGLWFGESDFGRSIEITTLCGLDTDCTAGQVGALVATARGSAAIPDAWSAPIGDVLDSTVVGMERLTFHEIAARTVAAAGATGPAMSA